MVSQLPQDMERYVGGVIIELQESCVSVNEDVYQSSLPLPQGSGHKLRIVGEVHAGPDFSSEARDEPFLYDSVRSRTVSNMI